MRWARRNDLNDLNDLKRFKNDLNDLFSSHKNIHILQNIWLNK